MKMTVEQLYQICIEFTGVCLKKLPAPLDWQLVADLLNRYLYEEKCLPQPSEDGKSQIIGISLQVKMTSQEYIIEYNMKEENIERILH